MKSVTVKHFLILTLFSYFCFMFGNGLVSLSAPDEVFYAQTAKEMLYRHSWMTPYLFGQPQFEKPIFIYWLLKASFMAFGVNSFAARFFPAVFGFIGVIAVYLFAKIGFKDNSKALLSAIILASCGFYIGLARTVFTDLVFSVFIILALLAFYWAYLYSNRKFAGTVLFFVFSALATLTKGPLGLFIPLLSVLLFLLAEKNLKFLFNRYFIAGCFIFLLLALPWYLLMYKLYGNAFLGEFFYNDHFRRIIQAEHPENDTWYFYPLFTLACIFPWSIFLLLALGFTVLSLKKKGSFYILLSSFICVVFVIFQSAHSKLASYVFPLFPALALICGDFIGGELNNKKPSKKILYILEIFLIIILAIPLLLFIVWFWFKKYLDPYVSSAAILYAFGSIYLIYGALMFLFIRKKALARAVYCLAAFVPLMVYLIPFLRIEPYISPREACVYLLKNYQINNQILSSKAFVRGVRYYTDKEVAVIDIPGTQFFSPHPIPFLDSHQKVLDFLKKQKTTFCVLKKSSVEDIENIVSDKLSCKILTQAGNTYVLKIEAK